ncbi:MAG: 23S rRNA (pseudouridine(1915)-N(3))-methyltransferase RlmH [Oscillospiraceae bacterium]|jgi:23S rRNA (pseudouridine1915-N3)-methyltransferase|nr:23S rRNA (pseudouridine(1915)-N(3))-methyltransferase RlmH [Oscillospiraceae bacterium]
MLNIEILCVGRMSQKWFSDGFEEYRKRLSAFDKVTVTEISEYRITDDTDSARAEAVKREGEVLLRHLREDGRSVRVAMCVEGKQYSSEELAQLLEKTRQETSRIVFVIGGSAGLSEEVKKECQVRISMSRMTFPHQMARMILAEQLYRAESIVSGMRYHK